jgi:transposase-like protein
LRYLQEYEAACETGQGGAYLRSQGLYSSLVTEWRRLREAGVLDPAAAAGTRPVKPSREQAEIARLRRENEQLSRRLASTEVALEILGKTQELLEQISKSSPRPGMPGKR